MISRPKTLAEVRDGCCQMYADVMNDPKRAGQVHEGVNALGKTIAAAKVHVKACAVARKKPSGDWAHFIGIE